MWYESPEWWVVILAGLTLLVLSYQAREMGRATKAMERSSGVLMNAEQGRIATYWEQVIHLDSSPKGVHHGELSHHFNWAVGNIGKTQVEVTQTWARFIAIKSLGDLPQEPDYRAPNEVAYQGEPLQPQTGTPKQQTESFSTPLETGLSFDEMDAEHRAGRCFLYAYGYVKYLDIWGRSHETRFGVVRVLQGSMFTDTWVVAGPPQYNKSTQT